VGRGSGVSVSPLRIGADHARRFLVRRHLLDPPRALPARAESVLEVVRRIGSLQFDPLETPGARSPDLVLHARIRNYRRSWADRWLYGAPEERRLFEAYNKSLNTLPIAELPFYRIAWERAAARYQRGIFAERAESVAAVLARLRDEGPLGSAAFAPARGGAAGATRFVDWHWAPTAEGRAILEALFESGKVAIARRDGSRRTFDLVERIYPAALLAERRSERESLRHKLLSRYRGVGLMGEGSASELIYGTGDAATRRELRAELVAAGALLPIEVEGLRGARFILPEERPLLEATARSRQRRAAEVTVLAPLDPFVWDRRLLRDLFAFEYLWEVYVPAEKRVHGYYVMPLLFGDRLVGRIEPRFDRRGGTLEVLGLWFEDGFDPLVAAGFVPALGRALEALRKFVGAERVRMRARARVARAVAGELDRAAR
jgi:uncharacterized protein YcaQ